MDIEPRAWEIFLQQLMIGLTNGSVIALIALGYTMVYGIIELINFAHGDLFMLGSFLALSVCGMLGLQAASGGGAVAGIALMLAIVPLFCACLNYSVDRLVYKPLRNAPKLTPLVSAIGVSFIFQNVGLLWGGIGGEPSVMLGLMAVLVVVPVTAVVLSLASGRFSWSRRVPLIGSLAMGGFVFILGTAVISLGADVFSGGRSAAAPKNFPDLVSSRNLLEGISSGIRFGIKDLMVIALTVPLMVGLHVFVSTTRLGKAMRATAQNPVAAKLMGIDSDMVIGATFIMGGALAGFGSVIYCLYINTVHFQMGYTAGLYAFTSAVLGGIGNIPGAVVGGLVIGVVRALSDQYIGAEWTPALLFAILIVILIFRPSGLLGTAAREKV